MRTHCLVLGSVVCVGFVIACVFHDQLESAGATHEARGAEKPTITGAAPQLATEQAVGQLRRYKVIARYDVELAQDGQRNALAVAVDGTWGLTIIRVTDGEVVMRGELAGTVTVGAAQPNAALAAELARPHYITVSSSGRVASFQFAAGCDAFAQGIVRSLATTTQLVRISGDATTWETEESDTQGTYVASYALTGRTLEKTKLRYVALAGGTAQTITSLAARTTFQVTDMLLPETISGDERVATSANGITIAAHTRVELSLVAREVVAVEGAELSGYETLGVSDAPRARGGRDADRDLLAGASLDELLAELVGADQEMIATVGMKLAALLRLDTSAADAVAQRVRASSDAEITGVLLGALGSTATPEAQHALVDLLDAKSLAAGTRADVAVAMAMVQQPLPEVTQALAGQLDAGARELRSSSGLALGAAAAQLAGSDADRARAIVDDLLARLAATSDPEEQVLLLRALGTAADVRALPALRLALASSSPRVRRVAVEALRSITEPTVDALIAQMLLGDPDAGVRRAAVFALGFRSITPVLGGLDRALAIDPDASVRTAIVKLLAQQANNAGARMLLARTAESDADADVRSEAARVLSAS